MKTLLWTVLLVCVAGVAAGADAWISIDLYRQNIFSISDCEYLKKMLPQYSYLLNNMVIARKEGKTIEYEFDISVEPQGEIAKSATLYKPDGTSIPLRWDAGGREFYFETDDTATLKQYFTFDDFAADFPAGQYRVEITFVSSGIISNDITIPDYDSNSFPGLPDANLIQDPSGQLILEWSTVDNSNQEYNVWVDNLSGFKEVYDEDFDLSYPQNQSTPLGIFKSRGNYELGVTAYQYGTSDANYDIEFASDTHLFSFKTPLPVYEDKATKCTVTAGKGNIGSLSFSGQLQAIEADFLNADSVKIEVSCNSRPDSIGLEFPVDLITLKNGKFSSAIKDPAGSNATASFAYDTKSHAYMFSLKNYNLTGLSSPIAIDISFTCGRTWRLISRMPTARDQFTGCVIDDNIYVFGGNGNPDGTNLNSGDVYGIVSDTWSPMASLTNDGIEELSGVGLDGKFYVFGGWGDIGPRGYYGVTNFNEVYDPATNTWTTLAPKPTTTAASVPAIYNNNIYLFGGYFSDEGPDDYREEYTTVEAYNPATNTWQYITEMPKVLSNPAVAVYGDAAYVIGGYDRQTRTMNKEVMVYHFDSDTWTRNYCTAPKEAARVYSYAAPTPVIDGKAFLIGGIEGTAARSWASNKVTTFDIALKMWGHKRTSPVAREGHLLVVHDDTFYMLGGYADEEDEDRTQNSVYALTPVDVGMAGECYHAAFELKEDVINSKTLCPPQLIQGLANSLTVDKFLLKPGKLVGQDTFTAQGIFTISGDPMADEPFVVTLGSQSVTVEYASFTIKNGVYTCINAPSNGTNALVSAKIDFNNCTYTLSIKNALIEAVGDSNFSLSVFGFPLNGFAQVDLGTMYSYWDLTRYDQPGSNWHYSSRAGGTDVTVNDNGGNTFEVYEDESDAYAYLYYAKEPGDAMYFNQMVIDSDDLEGKITLNTSNLNMWPSQLRPGQTWTSTSSMYGDMSAMGHTIYIVDGSASAKTVVNPTMVSIKVPAGTYNALKFDETWTMKGTLEYRNNAVGTISFVISQSNYAVPDYGIVKRIRRITMGASVFGAGSFSDSVSDTYQLTN